MKEYITKYIMVEQGICIDIRVRKWNIYKNNHVI